MAIEKVVMINIVASKQDEQQVLEQLILSKKLHIDSEHNELYENSYETHEYESIITPPPNYKQYNVAEVLEKLSELETNLTELTEGMKIVPIIDTAMINDYKIIDAQEDLNKLMRNSKAYIDELNEQEKKRHQLLQLQSTINCIRKKNIDFEKLVNLQNFRFQIGVLSYEHTLELKKNQENISAIITKIGDKQGDDIYLVLYPKKLKAETNGLLKSVNWQRIKIPTEFLGEVSYTEKLLEQQITHCDAKISSLHEHIYQDRDAKQIIINQIFTRIELEKETIKLREQVYHRNHVFIIKGWVLKKDKAALERVISLITEKYVFIEKDVSELGSKAKPPTLLKNHAVFKPFEMIVKLYGLPAYNEIDPTPFLALTLCLSFGIMFGDIGQGFIYLLAGLLIKNEIAKGVLVRLGIFSMAFGVFYGSLFGLEQHQLPWLPSVLGGSPLDTNNIMPILMASVVVGFVFLSISYLLGIINSFRKGDLEHGLFGKHGVFGYLFYSSLIFCVVALTGVINISPIVFVNTAILSLIIIILKQPLANLILKKRPLIEGDTSEYFVESGFEGLETVLASLSNAISFIRVGAFALNHAGLFMAFLIMSEMTTSIFLKIIILIIGNILILSLEGLVVFIQCLRLQYYEMFDKFFGGEGYAYDPIVLGKNNL
ncbi:MAG: hypothetical protein ATN35_06885 [Epulopiscium sp. Nele67-Bin004]|nr:MAG: hypothetical protein ATN35_06885 [Epulopiscium sp. Nele67-Bin004]